MIPEPETMAMAAVVNFIRARQPLYNSWSDEQLAGFITLQANQDCVRVIPRIKPSIEVAGLFIGWRLLECNVRHPEFVHAPWRFPLNDPGGDVMYLAEVVGFKGTIPKLLADFQWRNPDWRRLKYCALRRGKLKWYQPERFASRLEQL